MNAILYHYTLQMITKKSFIWKLISIRYVMVHLLRTRKFSPFHSGFSVNHNLCIQTMHYTKNFHLIFIITDPLFQSNMFKTPACVFVCPCCELYYQCGIKMNCWLKWTQHGAGLLACIVVCGLSVYVCVFAYLHVLLSELISDHISPQGFLCHAFKSRQRQFTLAGTCG